jgi:hypothetical protein
VLGTVSEVSRSSTVAVPVALRAVDRVAPLLLLGGAVLIGFAIDDRGARYSNASISMVAVAAVCIALAVFANPRVTVARNAARIVAVVAGLAVAGLVALQVASLVHPSDPLNLGLVAPFARVPSGRVFAVVALLGAAALMRSAWLRAFFVVAAAIAVVAMGSWVMRAPPPRVDVFMFEQVSAHTLVNGHDPYDAAVVRFRDIYGGENYGPSLTNGSVLDFGYPYPPISLALVTASNHWWHDPRRVEFACMAATVLLMFAFGRSRRSALLAAAASAVFATTPRAWYVIRSGYIEPQIVLLLTVTVFCACRWRPGLPYALGVLLVAKQYTPLLLPLTTLLVPWRAIVRRSFLVPMAATAAVCTLPALFARGFWRSVVMVQFLQPFRRDSLSFAAWWANHGHGQPSTALLFVPAIVAIVLCCRYAPRTPSGFAAASALVLLMFFAFAKQAFPNYYFLVIGALCIAVAAYTSPDAAKQDTGSQAAVAHSAIRDHHDRAVT